MSPTWPRVFSRAGTSTTQRSLVPLQEATQPVCLDTMDPRPPTLAPIGAISPARMALIMKPTYTNPITGKIREDLNEQAQRILRFKRGSGTKAIAVTLVAIVPISKKTCQLLCQPVDHPGGKIFNHEYTFSERSRIPDWYQTLLRRTQRSA